VVQTTSSRSALDTAILNWIYAEEAKVTMFSPKPVRFLSVDAAQHQVAQLYCTQQFIFGKFQMQTYWLSNKIIANKPLSLARM
jgi:hypothetical protein